MFVISHSPGQSVTLQKRNSVSLPVHSEPPFAGSGLSQRRSRCCTDVPQVALHNDQFPQAPHPPSTVANDEKNRI